ncbi:MAG: transglutaminase-like domain-containing protein [Candidatus Bathyarchaeia archaeon]
MRISKRLRLIIFVFVFGIVLMGLSFGSLFIGQMSTWDSIAEHEKVLRDLYSNSTQSQLKAMLPDHKMNFTDCLIWESQHINFTMNRPQYESVPQVLRNGVGACGEHVWVYGALCIAEGIRFRVVTVGYFIPGVVDHAWVQVNPSGDGKTWIQIDVADTCDGIDKGNTISGLWNSTINNNNYYVNRSYKMVLAYELNSMGEVTITDVTSTFSG